MVVLAASSNMTVSSRHIHAYLLLLPAFVFLVGFTHYPALGTLIDSLMSTPRAGRSAGFVGLENYQVMNEDPNFWKSLLNNPNSVLGLPS